MHASSFLLASVAAVAVVAAPSYPIIKKDKATFKVLFTYFNLLASKAQQSDAAASTCDLSAATLPTSSVEPALPSPAAGLVLKHVAIGRGTQNYTCATGNATAAPAAVGAVATLFNASCVAAAQSDVLSLLPAVAMSFNLSDSGIDSFNTRLYPLSLAVSGHHYFTTTTTPFFDLDSPSASLGQAHCAKNGSQPAPVAAADASNTIVSASDTAAAASNRGQTGEAAVPWLKLTTKDGATGNLREVYRVQTVGGSAPATCSGMPEAFEVQYAAEYWFYESA